MIHRYALRRPVSTVVGVVTLVVIGCFSLLHLPVSLLPELERPRVVITARSADSSRDQLLHGLTEPLERRLSAIPGIATIRSETEDGLVRIELETEWQTNADRLRIEVSRRVEGAGTIRPDELNVGVTSTERSPIVDVAVTGGGSGGARSLFADKIVVPELARLPGAGRVEVIGATPRRVVVRPLAAQLVARGLTADDVLQRLRTVGRSIPAGIVRQGPFDRPMVVGENVTSLQELAALRIPGGVRGAPASPPARTGEDAGTPLGDVAQLSIEEIAGRDSFNWSNSGQPPTAAVLVRVYRAPAANAVALARGVAARVTELNGSYTQGVRLEIVANRSDEVLRAVGELGFSAIAGVLLATLILRAILGSWKPTLALGVVIPVSLLVVFGVFFFAGVPIDVVSLAGLALATGLLVDNSIVVLEAIEAARARGDPDPVANGTQQVVMAVVASTVTLVIVFVPLLYLRGLARAFFGEQAFSIVASLSASLLFSLTLTPLLARGASSAAGSNPGFVPYRRLLDFALSRPLGVTSITIIASLLVCGGALLLDRDVLPKGDRKALMIRYRYPAVFSRDELARRASELERTVHALASRHSMESLASIRGTSENHEINSGEIDVSFRSRKDADAALAALREAVALMPDVRVDVDPRASTFGEAIGETERRAELVVSSATIEGAGQLADRVAARIEEAAGLAKHNPESKIQSLKSVSTAHTPDRRGRPGRPMVERAGAERPQPVVELAWNEPLLARMALDRAEAERQVRAALGEIDAGRADIAGAEPSIRLAATSSDLTNAPIRASGRVIPLGAVAEPVVQTRTPVLFRDNGRAAVRILVDRSAGTDPLELLAIAEKERRAGGDRVRLAGSALELTTSLSQLKLAFGLSIVLMFLALAALYESLLLPLVIIAAVPVAAAGGIAALGATGQTLNLMSGIGLIFLAGIVVNHAVVFIDRVEQLRWQGEPEIDALGAAAVERYRPILMTTVTAILGMVPLAVIGGEGVELRRALSVVVIGGLVTSMFATLVLVPLLHLLVERFRRRSSVRAHAGAARVSIHRDGEIVSAMRADAGEERVDAETTK